jgi:hypothetical protein
MPLRDHFHPPLDNKGSWEGFHGAWPTMMVMSLVRKLPGRFVAEPRAHLGTYYEIDVASYERDVPGGFGPEPSEEEGGVATAIWAPPELTLAIATDFPDQYEYEVVTTRQFNLSSDLLELEASYEETCRILRID